MTTEELAAWVEVQVPLCGEYDESPDHMREVAARLRELESKIKQLSAHTWEQERSAVVGFLLDRLNEENIRSFEFYPGFVADAIADIADGEHWPEGETL